MGDLVFQDCQDYYLQKPYHATYVRCENCGLLLQSPILPDVGVFYEAYPIHQEKSFIHRVMRQWVTDACYFYTSKFLASKKALTLLLYFGCGSGWFLDASRNPKLNLIGFEAEKSHAAHLSNVLGLPIYSDEKELLRDYEGTIDVVTMHFVLKHLTDLNKAFGVGQKLLKLNGLFYFIIPNIAS